jgi:hypothetical protein
MASNNGFYHFQSYKRLTWTVDAYKCTGKQINKTQQWNSGQKKLLLKDSSVMKFKLNDKNNKVTRC